MMVRDAAPEDIPIIVGYIQKKAAFDRTLGCFDGPLGMTPERIAQALFGNPAFAYAFIATSDGHPTGFAFYHYRFSSFQGRPSLWLDDLYVDADVRRAGSGVALMSALAKVATSHNCTQIAWTADARNPSGIPFYRKLGATLESQQGTRMAFSITPEVLSEKIASITAR